MRVLVSRIFPGFDVEALRRQVDVFVHEADHPMARNDLLAQVADCAGAIVTGFDGIDREFFDSAPVLRVVSNIGVGYDNIDLAVACERGVTVCNTPDVVTESTAEFTWALILGAARRVGEADRLVRSGDWHMWSPYLLNGVELAGKTLGICGLGRIGQAVARRAHAFGMRIVYAAPRRQLTQVEAALHASYASKEELLRTADIISLHLPLTPETRRYIGAEEFAAMKDTAILINAARGPIIDEPALSHALRQGQIAGAGLDVFDHEPDVHPDLLGLDNVLLAPHIGTATGETRAAMIQLAVRNCFAVLHGEIPEAVVRA